MIKDEDDSTQESGCESGFLFELMREREERIRKAFAGPYTEVKSIRFYGPKSIKDEWAEGKHEPCPFCGSKIEIENIETVDAD